MKVIEFRIKFIRDHGIHLVSPDSCTACVMWQALSQYLNSSAWWMLTLLPLTWYTDNRTQNRLKLKQGPHSFLTQAPARILTCNIDTLFQVTTPIKKVPLYWLQVSLLCCLFSKMSPVSKRSFILLCVVLVLHHLSPGEAWTRALQNTRVVHCIYEG